MEFKRGVEIRAAIFSLLLFPFSLYPSGLSLSLIGSRSQKLSRSRCRFSFPTSQETERETSQALGEENQSQWLSLSHQVLLSIFSTSPRIYRFQTPSLSLSLSLSLAALLFLLCGQVFIFLSYLSLLSICGGSNFKALWSLGSIFVGGVVVADDKKALGI